jgi:hypothetical protein
VPGCLGAASAAHQAGDEGHHEQQQEDEEQDLRNIDRTGSDAGKAEERGDQGDDQKYASVVQHDSSFQWMSCASDPAEQDEDDEDHHHEADAAAGAIAPAATVGPAREGADQ